MRLRDERKRILINNLNSRGFSVCVWPQTTRHQFTIVVTSISILYLYRAPWWWRISVSILDDSASSMCRHCRMGGPMRTRESDVLSVNKTMTHRPTTSGGSKNTVCGLLWVFVTSSVGSFIRVLFAIPSCCLRKIRRFFVL